ncbi:DNA cytosine methyltransferase [Nonomuraea sp. PA05]|uniref:DNA cytosine methyltransferase n=1 Tax=Nonomuraea sp. PA05 TaxID=2604466 RepID=UPI001CA3057F|nr:DNA cytosine methyltransferase [Nonomuraea sp. PA05]
MRRPPTIVDLFAGPGGLDVAARWLEVAAIGIELDKNACETRNAENLETRHDDVRSFKPADFGDATVLAGGPPCQTYTVAGSGTGRRALDEVLDFADRMALRQDVAADLEKLAADHDGDDRTGLVLEPLKWALQAIDDGNPYDAIVLEQVPAVLPVWQAMKTILEKEGYNATCGVLRAEEFGVPQTRRRAVLIARLDGEAVLPRPTHYPYQKNTPRHGGDAKLLPWVAMEDVLNRPEPFVVVSNYGTGGDPKNRGQRTSAEPAFTVTGKISRNRVELLDGRPADPPRFSLKESGQLQTFPSDYKWRGRDVAQQIGNAIPPRLATYILAYALGHGEAPLYDIFPDLRQLRSLR